MSFKSFKTFTEMGEAFKESLKSINKKDQSVNGIPSGFKKLDVIINGFQPSNLILVGSVSGMGKTSFAVSLIKKMAIENKCSIAFFSLEISSQQLLIKIIAQQTNISIEKLRLGLLNDTEIQLVSKKNEEIKNAPLSIFDYPFLTVSDIEDTLSCSPSDFPQIIIIDSLQFIAKNKKDQAGKILNKKELTKISFQLKKLAKKYNSTILLLVDFNLQINELDKSYCRRPLLSDLRKHAPIDTFADLVLLVYRPEYYKIEEWDDEEALPTGDEAEIIIAKNSFGNLETIRVQFDGSKAMFDNLPY